MEEQKGLGNEPGALVLNVTSTYLSPVIRLRLRKVLKKKGITPYALAKRARLSLTTIYRLTRKDGRFGRIEAETLDKICGVLKCEPGDLFERV